MKMGNPIRMIRAGICALTLLSGSVTLLPAQQIPGNESIDVVPPMVKFAGVLIDDSGKPPAGIVGVTFSLYRDQQGGAPLWMETQNVQPDKLGHYSVILGSAGKQGLPADLFTSGDPRWVGVQLQGQAEQARVMLVSVPYAMKAGDAATVGGLPASAFALAAPSSVVGSGATSSAGRVSTTAGVVVPGATVAGSGTAGFLPKFTGAATIGNSAVFQSGSSPTAKIGINTSTPTASLDVNGSAHVRGNVSAAGAVTASANNASYAMLGLNVNSTNFATGVLGHNSSTKGITFGVEGISTATTGVGVYGVNTTRSNTANLFLGNHPVGVWGDTSVFGIGVQATADLGYALAAFNNDPTGSFTGTFSNEQATQHNLAVLVAEGAFGRCIEDTDGNLGCSGTKSAIVPIDNGQRQVALYAVEAPQNWFEDFGSGQLSNGSATVLLDAAFAQTVSADVEYHVFLTPEGNCEGLYLSQKSPTGFEVHELRNGRSNVAFDYRIVALRKGYEQVRMADKTEQWKQLREQRAKLRATSGPQR